jgi:hypothetical protein
MVRYFTPEEVALHCTADDCWVSIFDKVYDLTKLLEANRGFLSLPLIEAAGTSISHWFSVKTGDVRTYMEPEKNIIMPYTPQGRFIHVPPPNPTDDFLTIDLPWWKDLQYVVGKVRFISIL